MESNSRSPIFANFGEVLEGIVTVRAFSAEGRFLDDLHKKIDMTTKVCTFCATFNAILSEFFVDVVQLLDDQPLAITPLRCSGRVWCSDHDHLRALRLR